MNLKRVHFGGGGIAVLSYAGFLSFIEHHTKETDIISNFDISGTSAGAIFGFLILLGYTSEQLMQMFIDMLLSGKLHTFLTFQSLQEFEQTGSFIHLNELWNTLHDLCMNKSLDFDTLTFEELYTYSNREFCVVATSITRSRAEFFKHTNHPQMFIKTALQISSCIPFCFLPIEYKNELYIDGAITDQLECLTTLPNTLVLVSCHEFQSFTNLNDFKKTQMQNMFMYITNMFHIVLDISARAKTKHFKHTIQIPPVAFLDTKKLTRQLLIRCFIDGYDRTEQYFKKTL